MCRKDKRGVREGRKERNDAYVETQSLVRKGRRRRTQEGGREGTRLAEEATRFVIVLVYLT